MYIQASIFLLCNTPRAIDGDAQARVVVFPATYTFGSAPDAAEKVKEKTPEHVILSDINNLATQRAFLSLVFGAYSEEKPKLCSSVLNAIRRFKDVTSQSHAYLLID